VALASVGWEAIKGAGRSSLLNWITALGVVLGLPLIVVLVPFGLVGVGIAISVTYLVLGCVTVELARKVVGASYRDVVGCLVPSTLSALVAFVVVFPLERLVVSSAQYIEPLGLTWVAAECLLFLLVYVAVLRVVSPTRYRGIRDFAERAVSKLRGLCRRQA
jgi:O-antigen/teichoic acid export membrane protein